MAERPKAIASKAIRQQCLAGSNPAPSAINFINEIDGGFRNNVFRNLRAECRDKRHSERSA